MRARIERLWDRYLAAFGIRAASDGWTPNRRQRMAVAAALALVAYSIVSEVWETRGALVGLAVLVFLFAFFTAVRGDRAADFARRRPYLDAAWSIPVGAFATLFLFPNWSFLLCALVTAAYAAGIFALTRRRVKRSSRVV